MESVSLSTTPSSRNNNNNSSLGGTILLWNDLHFLVANTLHNWTGNARSYHRSGGTFTRRRPGFTEQWGTPPLAHERPILGWVQQEQTTELQEESQSESNPKPKIRLVQFRPAWAVQLLLRTSGLPYVVENSTYATTEATGPLPMLQDPEALVGGSDSKAILHYLHDRYASVTLADVPIDTSSNAGSASAPNVSGDQSTLAIVESLLQNDLADVLTMLRYADSGTWKAVERPRHLKAVQARWWIGQWHVDSIRQVALTSLGGRRRTSNVVHDTITQAKQAYAFLEHTLQQSPHLFLNNAHHFSIAGLWLFEHVMYALADTHLVQILPQYPGLCWYTQTVWETYFEDGTTSFVSSTSYLQQAQQVIEANAFFFLPTTASYDRDGVADGGRNIWPWLLPSSNLDHTSSVSSTSWQARLTTLMQQAAAERPPPPRLVSHTTTTPAQPTPTAESSSTAAEAAVATYQTNDQRWVATVVLLLVSAIIRSVSFSDSDE
jgi:glutathione S-transferase